MSQSAPAFPPDVAAALQAPVGRVSLGARHRDVTLAWDDGEISVEVRDQHDTHKRRPLRGSRRADAPG